LRGVRGVYNPEYSKKPERKLKQNFQLKNHSLPSITTSKLWITAHYGSSPLERG
jgi:hypothetical protein